MVFILSHFFNLNRLDCMVLQVTYGFPDLQPGSLFSRSFLVLRVRGDNQVLSRRQR
ncbi:uncharacterized protein BDW47DRAFT_102381 [Aspergillus candidus]|uniref:Uncharacterized protein n=1 Tax=Aspergillus candidus TaxID=41067 RepID=A0A2I2FGN1_ASPCN|nr:hypothetical protein BDW47DRAFT_102381 [Aspergillus candidus]PLB39774.1 hypothetical protein BDW47DRAFT_102381 [Aspergillus candidus]